MGKIFLLTLALVIAFTLTACGGAADTPSPAPSAVAGTSGGTDVLMGNSPAPTATGQLPDVFSSASPSASDTANISELAMVGATISLSATLHGDGTIAYTYQDASIRPSYMSEEKARYHIAISGIMVDSKVITTTSFRVNSQAQSDGTQLLDLAGMTGHDGATDEYFPVTVDSNGLRATWVSREFDEGALEDLSAFSIGISLDVGGEYIYREQLILGMEVLQ